MTGDVRELAAEAVTDVCTQHGEGVVWDGPASFPLPHGVDQPDRPWLVADSYRPNQVFVANSEGAGDVVIWRSTWHRSPVRWCTTPRTSSWSASSACPWRPIRRATLSSSSEAQTSTYIVPSSYTGSTSAGSYR